MRVLAWVHLYPPKHCAGAEMMLHEILLGLVARGHQVQVVCNETPVDQFEGVPLTAADHWSTREHLEWSDIAITHLDCTQTAIRAVRTRRPLVHLVHNDRQLAFHKVRLRDAQLVVANSQWIQGAIAWPGPVIVVPPPVDPDRYRAGRDNATAITLVNLSAPKGGATFWKIARRMPEHEFIGVVGGYATQILPDPVPANVTIVPHGPHMRAVYARTRILLIPSEYESWGRVGVEAAASGIPSIAHPTPGLRESLADSGIFVDRSNVPGWVKAIRRLDDPVAYYTAAIAARARSEQLRPAAHIDRLEQAMLTTITEWKEH